MRKHFGPNVWSNRVIERARDRQRMKLRTVVTDVRFHSEATLLQSAGALIIRVTRPGYEPDNSHARESEIMNLPVDVEILNDSTVHELHHRVRAAVANHTTFKVPQIPSFFAPAA